MFDKARMTDLVSLVLIAGGASLPEPWHTPLIVTGLFAFSGAVTNQLAIFMLFHRVPGLYGSGVIEKNFRRFKDAIRSMIMQQFFTPEKLDAFFAEEERSLELGPLVESTDFTPAFEALKQSVLESKLGSMLQLFGGEEALESLREPFVRRLRSAVVSIVSSETFRAQMDHYLKNSSLSRDLIERIDELVRRRLDELSPSMVRDLVERLIREHLGWLVVWGGVFGGIIGFLSSLLFSI